MNVNFTSLFVLIALFFVGCDSSSETGLIEEPPVTVTKPFTQGSLEMGVFSKDVDLGKFVGKVDFSRPDVKKQFEELLASDPESKAIFEVVENVGKNNPLAAFALTLNIAECTYYIKDDVVLARAQGFGWHMDNYHNKAQDKGSIYHETVVQTDKIPDQDKQIYTLYKPSENAGAGASNDLDLSQFNRKMKWGKHNVLGYECDVIVYTPKTIIKDAPLQLQQLVVYTSPLFNNTMNFTHPFYLIEDGGILRLDIYYLDTKEPTIVMKPIEITERTLTGQELISRTASPVYTQDDLSWGFKALAIMMSGWRELEN